MARKNDDWLKAYLTYCDNTEPATQLHIFTALSTLSAAVQRKVWLPWGHHDLYPNLYVCLVAPPGGRKGTAMKIGKRMLDKIGIPMAADCITREALIQELQSAMVIEKDDQGNIIETKSHASLSVFSEEFAVFIGDSNPNMVITLTDLFDCPSTWKYATKNKGRNDLTNVYVNLIGAITPSLLQSKLTSDAVGGGLISRIIFVCAKGKRKPIALPFLTREEITLGETLIEDLDHINKLEGPFRMSKEAYQQYATWYVDPNFTRAVPSDKFVGYNERRSIHLRKIAMLLSISNSDDLIIRTSHLIRAMSILEAAEAMMPMAFHGIGKANNSDVTADIANYIKLKGTVTGTELTSRFIRDVNNTQELNGIIDLLNQAGLVKIIHKHDGTNMHKTIKYNYKGEDKC